MDSLLDYDRDLLAPPWGGLGRDATLGIVAGASKFVLQLLNSTRVLNHDTYTSLVTARPRGVGLLTISNHTSTFDDPGLPCALLPWSFFWTEHTHGKNRWTMCASDICFTNELLRQFFLSGKTLPVERGAGVSQASISVAARALAGGDWLHIFPEGRVVPDGQVGPFRQGIGKLLCDARALSGRDPVVLPYYHSGMGHVMPFKSSLPRAGHTVHVVVGQPLNLGAITCRCNQPGEDQQQVWRDLAAALRNAVCELEAQGSVPPNPNQLERPEVAAWEQRYQERQRKRREAAAVAGSEDDGGLMRQLHAQPALQGPGVPQAQQVQVQQGLPQAPQQQVQQVPQQAREPQLSPPPGQAGRAWPASAGDGRGRGWWGLAAWLPGAARPAAPVLDG